MNLDKAKRIIDKLVKYIVDLEAPVTISQEEIEEGRKDGLELLLNDKQAFLDTLEELEDKYEEPFLKIFKPLVDDLYTYYAPVVLEQF